LAGFQIPEGVGNPKIGKKQIPEEYAPSGGGLGVRLLSLKVIPITRGLYFKDLQNIYPIIREIQNVFLFIYFLKSHSIIYIKTIQKKIL